MERNIRLLPWLFGLKQTNIYVVFFAPFLLEIGLTPAQSMLLIGVSYTTNGLTEIHTGYFADRYGRKLAIVLGTAGAAAGFAVYATLNSLNVWAFVAAVLSGVGLSLLLGADNALLYESYCRLGQEPLARRAFARLSALGGVTEGTAALLGCFVLQPYIGNRGIMAVQSLLFVATFVLALQLTEPPLRATPARPGHMLRRAMRRPRLAVVLAFGSVGGNLSDVTVWWAPLYFMYTTGLLIGGGAGGWVYSVFWAAFLLSLWPFHFAFPLFDRYRTHGLWVLLALSLATYMTLAAARGLWAFAVLFVLYFVRANILPVIEQLINEQVADEERATIHSARRAITRMVTGLLMPLSGWMATVTGGGAAIGLLSAGLAVLALCTVTLVCMQRSQVLSQQCSNARNAHA